MEIVRPTTFGLLRTIRSGVALDVAKNHTGVVIWDGKQLERRGFSLADYDKSSPFAEYKMRMEFKEKLGEIVSGLDVDYCVIEDVYCGSNFDTVRKLLALQTVIDELICERKVYVGTFYRWPEATWFSKFRQIYKQSGLVSKVETQVILEYLRDDFYLENKDLSKSEKEAIFFEDICDATAMLLSVAMHSLESENLAEMSESKISIKDIKMFYSDDMYALLEKADARVNSEEFVEVTLGGRDLEKAIISEVAKHPNDVLCAFLPSSRLGVFGVRHGFKYYPGDEGYLVFYLRRKKVVS